MVQSTLLVAAIVDDSEPAAKLFCHTCRFMSTIANLSFWHSSSYTICGESELAFHDPLRTLHEATYLEVYPPWGVPLQSCGVGNTTARVSNKHDETFTATLVFKLSIPLAIIALELAAGVVTSLVVLWKIRHGCKTAVWTQWHFGAVFYIKVFFRLLISIKLSNNHCAQHSFVG